jgi:hypothetical protein
MLVIATISPVQARTINCIGMDSANRTIKLIANGETEQMIINGDIHDTNGGYIGRPKSKIDVVFTKNYVSVNGNYVYNTLGVFTHGKFKGNWFLSQRNAITHKMINYIQLSCNIDK